MYIGIFILIFSIGQIGFGLLYEEVIFPSIFLHQCSVWTKITIALILKFVTYAGRFFCSSASRVDKSGALNREYYKIMDPIREKNSM